MKQCILACDTFDFNFWSLIFWEATDMCIFSSHSSHRFQNIFYFFCTPNITQEITILVKFTTCFYTFGHFLTISTHSAAYNHEQQNLMLSQISSTLLNYRGPISWIIFSGIPCVANDLSNIGERLSKSVLLVTAISGHFEYSSIST